jgi:lipoate-protein ligase A
VTLVGFNSPDPALHLACGEILLNQAEAGERGETLRFCEIGTPVVVLGIGGEWEKEVRRDRCIEDGVPILRRASGGGTVVLARGSLDYALVLDTEKDRALTGIRESYEWILSRIANALSKRGVDAVHAGLSDLAWRNRKIGGSAQRRKLRYILHHGTLLYDFDLSLLPRYLEEPPEAPEYRAGRGHEDFVTNASLSREDLRDAVREAFGVTGAPVDITPELTDAAQALAEEKYRSDEWTFRL